MSKVILFTSGKGGVGKSTICSLVARRLASENQKVLIIDADMGLKNINLILKIKKEQRYDFIDVLKGRIEIEEILSIDHLEQNLYILPLYMGYDTEHFPNDGIEIICNELKDRFDYILIDSPAGIEKGFINCLKPSKKAFVILNDTATSFNDSKIAIKIMKKYRIDDICLVFNRVKVNNFSINKKVEETRLYFQINNTFVIPEIDIDKYLQKNYRKDKHLKKIVDEIENNFLVKI